MQTNADKVGADKAQFLYRVVKLFQLLDASRRSTPASQKSIRIGVQYWAICW